MSATRTFPQAAAIALEDVTIAYDRHPAVHHLSGVFAAGSLTALIGPNGAGKTTLLKGIAGLLRPDEGSIRRPLAPPARLAYLAQRAELDLDFPITLADTLSLGLVPRIGLFGGADASARRHVLAALEQVGLGGLERRAIGSLSTGQIQRALFARLVVQDAALLLLDEPFAALDQPTTADLLALIGAWQKEGRTVIAAVHDLDQVRRHFPQTLLIAGEPIAWGATSEVLSPANLARAWGLGDFLAKAAG
jgi:zinc/manganese transport system ATP-binding protein